jgi:hypothetical protein
MEKKYLMIVGTEFLAPGLGNWHYFAAWVPEEIARMASLNPTNKVFETENEEEFNEISDQIKKSLSFQLWANQIFHSSKDK